MLLVGYHSTSAYKLYCPETNKVEVSRDVVVKESEAWDWNKSQPTSDAVITSEDESEVEGSGKESEADSEESGDEDSDPDSDDGPESGGDNASGRENSEDVGSGGQTSRDDHVFEGGNSEDMVSGQGPEANVVLSSGEYSEQVQRPQRIRTIPRRFADLDMLQDTEVNSEGEVIQCAMLVDSKPLGIEEALKKKG